LLQQERGVSEPAADVNLGELALRIQVL
jgi:hypothetical protein